MKGPDSSVEYLVIGITNIGNREAQISGIGWRVGLFRKALSFQLIKSDGISSQLPIRLKDEPSACKCPAIYLAIILRIGSEAIRRRPELHTDTGHLTEKDDIRFIKVAPFKQGHIQILTKNSCQFQSAREKYRVAALVP